MVILGMDFGDFYWLAGARVIKTYKTPMNRP